MQYISDMCLFSIRLPSAECTLQNEHLVQQFILLWRLHNMTVSIMQISRQSLSPETSYIAKPAASWLDDFLIWMSPEAFGCCRKFVNGNYCPPDDQVIHYFLAWLTIFVWIWPKQNSYLNHWKPPSLWEIKRMTSTNQENGSWSLHGISFLQCVDIWRSKL